MIVVGLDRSRCKHDFVMMNLQGEILERGTVAHNTNALEELATRIEHRVDSAKQVRVGLELNDGALLAWLVTKGYTIFGIQPKSAQRARDIYRPSGTKDDKIDAFVLAQFVRVNADRLRPWSAPSEITLQLRELVRWREGLVQQRTARSTQFLHSNYRFTIVGYSSQSTMYTLYSLRRILSRIESNSSSLQ